MMRTLLYMLYIFFFFQAEDGIRDKLVTGVQTCALPISQTSRPGVISRHVGRRTGLRSAHKSLDPRRSHKRNAGFCLPTSGQPRTRPDRLTERREPIEPRWLRSLVSRNLPAHPRLRGPDSPVPASRLDAPARKHTATSSRVSRANGPPHS